MLTARSHKGLSEQLYKLYQDAHFRNDESLANKLYKLQQDVIFDRWLTPAQIKARYAKITTA